MYNIIYPKYDATIYERFPDKNTGTDQILELQSIKEGQPTTLENDYYPSTLNSRILLNFDVLPISSSVNGKLFKSYLILKATEATELPIDYTLYAYPLSGSWTNGTGYYSNNPPITNGVSWTYRSAKTTGTVWATSSYAANTTGSWSTTAGGGNWYTDTTASQTFSYQSPDVRMDITTIVSKWLSGSYQNNGLILKFSDSDEQSLDILGNIKFFSKDTHTIYLPKIETYWDDTVLTGTGSYSEVTDDFILYIKNLQESYSVNDKPKIWVGSRDRNIVQTYATSSNYIQKKRLPVDTYYFIQDAVTYETILEYDLTGTKLNCDSNGNYLKLDCSSFMPERYYKIMFRVVFGDGTVRHIDNNNIFRITKR